MGEPKFTPGPWRVDPNYNCDVQTQDKSLEIASTAPVLLRGGEKPDGTEPQSNAHLIAAAPDLYVALEVAKRMIDDLVNESTRSIEYGEEDPFRMGEWFDADDLSAIANIRAALAKARGEA